MMMMAPPPPPIPYPTPRKHSTLSSMGGLLKSKSVALSSTGYSGSLMSEPTLPPAYSDLSSLNKPTGSLTAQPGMPSQPSPYSLNALPLIGSNPTGKAPELRQQDRAPAIRPMMRHSRFTSASPPPPPVPQPSSPQSAFRYSSGLSDVSASSSSASPSGPFTGAAPSAMYGAFGSMLKKPTRPGVVFESQDEYASAALHEERFRRADPKVSISFAF